MIILCGMPKVGKSFFAPLIAEKLGWPSIDLDQMIGPSYKQIFHEQGEAYFREKEREALLMIQPQKAVLALGGGTLTVAPNVSYVKNLGSLVYLEMEKERLQGDWRLAEWEKRVAVFEANCDLKVRIDQLSNQEVIWQVIRLGTSLESRHGENRTAGASVLSLTAVPPV